MAQSFDCLCGSQTCRGRISGAKDMSLEQLKGLWLNGHIRELLEDKAAGRGRLSENGNSSVGHGQVVTGDLTAQALKDALKHAEQVVASAKLALRSYVESNHGSYRFQNDHRSASVDLDLDGSHTRQGPTSRELSGEMGGDTTVAVQI